MALLDTFKSFLKTSSAVNGPSSGLYHYAREDEHEKSRIHLRVDPDGTGTLIINANRVMHLNPTAALMAHLILEGKEDTEIIKSVSKQYQVATRQVKDDLSSFHFQLNELIRP